MFLWGEQRRLIEQDLHSGEGGEPAAGQAGPLCLLPPTRAGATVLEFRPSTATAAGFKATVVSSEDNKIKRTATMRSKTRHQDSRPQNST